MIAVQSAIVWFVLAATGFLLLYWSTGAMHLRYIFICLHVFYQSPNESIWSTMIWVLLEKPYGVYRLMCCVYCVSGSSLVALSFSLCCSGVNCKCGSLFSGCATTLLMSSEHCRITGVLQWALPNYTHSNSICIHLLNVVMSIQILKLQIYSPCFWLSDNKTCPGYLLRLCKKKKKKKFMLWLSLSGP